MLFTNVHLLIFIDKRDINGKKLVIKTTDDFDYEKYQRNLYLGLLPEFKHIVVWRVT